MNLNIRGVNYELGDELEQYIEQKYAETADWVQHNPLTERDTDPPG